MKNCKKILTLVSLFVSFSALLHAKTFKEKASSMAEQLCCAIVTACFINAAATVPFIIIESSSPLIVRTLEVYSLFPLIYSASKLQQTKKGITARIQKLNKQSNHLLFLSFFHVSCAIATSICALHHLKKIRKNLWLSFTSDLTKNWKEYLKNEDHTVLSGVRDLSWLDKLVGNAHSAITDDLRHKASLFHHLVAIPVLLNTAYELYQSTLPTPKKPYVPVGNRELLPKKEAAAETPISI